MKIDINKTIHENVVTITKKIHESPEKLGELIEFAYHLKKITSKR